MAIDYYLTEKLRALDYKKGDLLIAHQGIVCYCEFVRSSFYETKNHEMCHFLKKGDIFVVNDFIFFNGVRYFEVLSNDSRRVICSEDMAYFAKKINS